ncbi:retrovirus-related pol polyprotein from transposon TNT 1-94 [Tanacetum coccineum]
MVFKEVLICVEIKNGVVDGFVDACLVSNGASKLDMADVEHIKVESIRKASRDGLDSGNGDSAFVDQLEWVLWYATWLSDQLEWNCGMLHSLVINWSSFAIETSRNRVNDITKTSVGLFYFMFINEAGMKAVLESGPWMVNNIPLVLNVWEYGIWIERVEHSTGYVKTSRFKRPFTYEDETLLDLELLYYYRFSSLSKPMLMDKLTKERCLKKYGKLDFAIILVEVSTMEDVEYLNTHKGFAAALAVLITGASQSRQHGKSEPLMEVASAFGPIKAYHFKDNAHPDSPCAFVEYADQSVAIKACAGLNGIKFGRQVMIVTQATPDASLVENNGEHLCKRNSIACTQLARDTYTTTLKPSKDRRVLSVDSKCVLAANSSGRVRATGSTLLITVKLQLKGALQQMRMAKAVPLTKLVQQCPSLPVVHTTFSGR